MDNEKNDLPQITKDSDIETDDEPNPSVNKIDYKYIFFSIGIVGLGLFLYNQSKKPEKIVMGKETEKPIEKKKKEIDPFEFN